MKIVKLQAENIKRLRAVEISPDGNTVVIAGKNGQGKTSVLDSIWFALGGGPAARGTSKPIRDGEDHAQVTLDLGELRVTRTWKGDKTSLKVESADGASYRSPQSMLDSLVGRLSFDPLAFAQQDERTQLASLLELVELPFDPDELALRRAALYEQRTQAGRDGKQLEGRLGAFPTAPEGLPTEEISVADLIAEHRAAREVLAKNKAARQRMHQIANDRGVILQEIAGLEGQLLDARRRADQAQGRIEAFEVEVRGLVDPDIEAIERQLAEVETSNAAIRSAKQRAEIADQLTAAKTTYDALTARITALDEQKTTAIAEARMPIDGLAFDADGVTYRGVPFKQCSAAEQLRVSLAMAMAMNPRIKVVRITDGSLLDSDNMRLIEQMAADQDFQVWIERVDESGAVGVVIEDGLVAS